MTMTLEQSQVGPIITNTAKLLEEKCISLNGKPVAWQSLFATHMPRLLSSRSASELAEVMNRVLTESGLSHMAFFHESADRVPSRYAVNATFRSYDSPEGPRWMFLDVLEGGPVHAAGIRSGELLLAVEDHRITPPDPPTFGLGRDLVVTVEGHDGSARRVTLQLPKSDGKQKPPMAEPRAVTARQIDTEVGLVRVAFFPGANGVRFARQLEAALAEVKGCTRLIVDLRGNLGGFVGALRLMSYLTPERIPVGYSLTRARQERGFRKEDLIAIGRLPESKWQMLMMGIRFKLIHKDRSVRLITEGLGSQPFHGRVVMLVNEHTCSAGEMVAGFAAEHKLAMLVGTRTSGLVLGGANFSVGEGFKLRFPLAGWYTWGGEMLEGRGVEPSVDSPLSMEALRSGSDSQLDQAIEIVRRM